MLAKLVDMREAANIRRFHTARVLKEQTVGAHSYGVAVVLMLVAPECRAEVLKAALVHDLGELATGDIPAHVKWEHPTCSQSLGLIELGWLAKWDLLVDLTFEERELLKWCDMFELLMFVREEMNYGNSYAADIERRARQYLVDQLAPNTRTMRLLEEYQREFC